MRRHRRSLRFLPPTRAESIIDRAESYMQWWSKDCLIVLPPTPENVNAAFVAAEAFEAHAERVRAAYPKTPPKPRATKKKVSAGLSPKGR